MQGIEVTSGTSNVTNLVGLLKAGKMSKDDVLEQLRRIQQEKRAAVSRAAVSPTNPENPHLEKRSNIYQAGQGADTAFFDTSSYVVPGVSDFHISNKQDLVAESRNKGDAGIRSWVEEEASLLAEEEEVCE